MRAIAALSGALAVMLAACGPSRGDYVRKNSEVLDGLPMIPGAAQVRIESRPYFRGDSGPADGYTTTMYYRASGRRPGEILDFYEQQLPSEWTRWREEVPCLRLDSNEPCDLMVFLNATRGTAFLQVDVSNVNTPLSQFSIVVDHDSPIASPTQPPGTPRPTPSPTP